MNPLWDMFLPTTPTQNKDLHIEDLGVCRFTGIRRRTLLSESRSQPLPIEPKTIPLILKVVALNFGEFVR